MITQPILDEKFQRRYLGRSDWMADQVPERQPQRMVITNERKIPRNEHAGRCSRPRCLDFKQSSMNGVDLRRPPRTLLFKSSKQCGQKLIIQPIPLYALGFNRCAECILVLTPSERTLVFEAMDRLRRATVTKLATWPRPSAVALSICLLPPFQWLILKGARSLARGRPVACSAAFAVRRDADDTAARMRAARR